MAYQASPAQSVLELRSTHPPTLKLWRDKCNNCATFFEGVTMSITTTSTLPAPVQQSFSYKLLSVPVPK